MSPHLSQLLSLQKIEQMEVVDAFVITTTGPLIQTNHILGIIVRDGKQVAELACTGLLIAHLESSLHIDTHIAVQRNKIDFLFTLLTNKHIGIKGMQLKINRILDKLMDVALPRETQVTVAYEVRQYRCGTHG